MEEKRERVAAGIVGALLGGVLGGASLILFGQIGVISAISGVILAFCTLKGYELLAGQMSKVGIVVSIVIMLVVPYLADRIQWAMIIAEELQWEFGDAFRYVHEVVEAAELQAEYWKDMLFVYVFTALGAFGIIRQTAKPQKQVTDSPEEISEM